MTRGFYDVPSGSYFPSRLQLQSSSLEISNVLEESRKTTVCQTVVFHSRIRPDGNHPPCRDSRTAPGARLSGDRADPHSSRRRRSSGGHGKPCPAGSEGNKARVPDRCLMKNPQRPKPVGSAEFAYRPISASITRANVAVDNPSTRSPFTK